MPFELFVALRYLRAKRKQTMVSVISAISMLGICAGVMALVIALALSTGFREDIQAKIVGATAHVNLIRFDNTPIAGYEDLLRKLESVQHVTGIAPAIFNQVFVVSDYRSQGAVLKGVVPSLERQVSDFFSHVVDGDPDCLAKPPPPEGPDQPPAPANLIIGREMSKALGARVGDTLRIFTPQGKLSPFGMTPSAKRFRVAAVFESGLWDFDSNWAYTSMSDARRLFSLPSGSASVLQFRTDDLEQAPEAGQAILSAAGEGFTVTTWIDLNRPLFAALKLEKLALFITISLIVFVASLNIVTTLIMMVLEKQRDIAILTAMGATEKTILSVFVLQGVVIGVVGTVIGAVLGVVVCGILDRYELIQLQAEVYSIPYVPFHVNLLDVTVVCLTALLISFAATLYPAWKASRLDPVEALRYE